MVSIVILLVFGLTLTILIIPNVYNKNLGILEALKNEKIVIMSSARFSNIKLRLSIVYGFGNFEWCCRLLTCVRFFVFDDKH